MSSKFVKCLIRGTAVAATPEELVRQGWLKLMVQQLGYPLGSIALEKALNQIPHLATTNSLPQRRPDIICFAKGIHPIHELYPLLLIECKAIPLTEKVMNQVAGYNHYIGAYFLAVVNEKEVFTGWFDAQKGSNAYINRLPSYREILTLIQGKS